MGHDNKIVFHRPTINFMDWWNTFYATHTFYGTHTKKENMTKPEYEIKSLLSVRSDEEYRFTCNDPWIPGPALFDARDRWVEVRPRQRRLPDPSYIVKYVLEGRTHFVTTVELIRDRTDLNQWEYAGTDVPRWYPVEINIERLADALDNHPIIVRRKQDTGARK